MNGMKVIALPVLMVGILALGGCSRSTPTQKIPPGGTYRSSSAGASFEQSIKIADSSDTIAGYDLGKIHRSLQDAALIYIAAGKDGMVISHDDGVTWSPIALPLAGTIDVIQTISGVFLAAGVDSAQQGIVTRSIDGGKTWQNVLTLPISKDKKTFQIIKGGSTAPASVISMEVDPFQKDRIWAGTNDGTLFAGEQNGKTWRKVIDITSNASQITGDRSGAGIIRLIPSPFNANNMLIITKDKRLLEFKDKTISEIKIPVDFDAPTPFGIAIGSQKILSASYVPGFPDALLVGTDTGAVVTRDGGKSWIALKLPLDASKVLSSIVVTLSPTNSNRIFVIADGIVYRSEDGGTSWNTTDVGPAGYPVTDISINPANAAHMLAVVKAPSA
ncbi:MAG TPA: hypothetical protein VLG69_03010 [Candidatus Andersenbacteria bacterium]|nr:hypothetical protein [Candidatus Andersenbacteria bacterium]